MKAVVTGCAGFVGSTLADTLIARGDQVFGIDAFTSYYDRARKERNLADLGRKPGFELVEGDLRTADLAAILDGADVVFHLAAQPGVRRSWREGFDEHAGNNVLATQRLLEAAVAAGGPRFVYASSSSVYGEAAAYPTVEDDLPRPHSPYGVTKLAAEHLCGAYAANHELATVSLRYFTVYGPRQRPDMAIHRMLDAGLAGTPFPLYGDGTAVRDFTYVDDVVAATIAAAEADVAPGTVLNVAGGGEIAVKELLDLAGEVVGRAIPVAFHPAQPGDVTRTGGAIDRAQRLLGWEPKVAVPEGVAAQAAWQRALPATRPGPD
jgi:UDP-glucuronate 4-epimerase